MSIRTLLLASSAEALAKLSAALRPHEDLVQVSSRAGGAAELSGAILEGSLDLVVAHLPAVSEADLARIETTLREQPRVALILVTDDTSADFLLRAMRAGVREVVPATAGREALGAAFSRQVERLGAINGVTRKAKVIAFMPAKGGSGATFLATNLAYVLASRGQKVAVLDMNLQFGDVALFLTEQRPTANIADVCREAHRLDAALLESSMMNIADNLWLLAAPDSAERSVEVKPDVVERIIALLRPRFDYVILDVGRVLESVSIRALDEAETIYLVLQAALPTLHSARRLIVVLNGLGYGRDKLKIVVNRVDKGGDIGIGEIAKTLGYDVVMQVPNSYASVVHSINHGIPILRHVPKDPVSRALVEWAESLAPKQEARGGWLRGIFGARS